MLKEMKSLLIWLLLLPYSISLMFWSLIFGIFNFILELMLKVDKSSKEHEEIEEYSISFAKFVAIFCSIIVWEFILKLMFQ